MKVKELIQFLQQQPQDMEVAYALFSEYCLLKYEDIDVKDLCEPRPDGWIHRARKDKALQQYLVFPGN